MRICAEFMREVFLWKGTTIVLCGSEHILGRTVKEEVCRIESLNVSGMHCTISRRVCDVNGKVQPLNHEFSPGDRVMICIKDSRYCLVFFAAPQSMSFIFSRLGIFLAC
jgi:hypothetical protein